METEGKTSHPQAFNLESGSIKDDQILEEVPASAHAIGNG